MTLVLRIGIAVLAVIELGIGVLNQFWPRFFYDSVPTVNLTPPFAEHSARDFGGASLGLGVVLAAAVIVPRTVLVIPALLGVSAFAIPHVVFHLHHLEHATPSEAAFLGISLGVIAVAPAALLVVALLRWRRERRLRHPAVG